MSKRDAILDAAADLFWLHGYEATSPRMIQAQSGAGQGSFYHHFKSKSGLAAEVLSRVSLDLESSAEAVLASDAPPASRLSHFLLGVERDAKRGCRLGRLSHEHTLMENAELRVPVRRYFDVLIERLASTVAEAQAAGELPSELDSEQVAATIAATIQGAYVIARATERPATLEQALRGLEQLLGGFSAP